MTFARSDHFQDPARDMPGSLLPSQDGLDVFIRHYATPNGQAAEPERPAVLYVHGATFPSGLSIGYPFEGQSWAGELAQAGLDVWALDFVGFGRSSRYPQQDADPTGVSPLGRAAGPGGAGEQLLRVLEHVVEVRGGGQVSLLAHSWGTIAAGVAATTCPELVDRLVLFGPITARTSPDLPDTASIGGWYPLTVQAQYDRFIEDVPAGHPPILTEQFDSWARHWLATDPTSTERTPPSVRTPSGPRADISAAWSDDLAYDPTQIHAPTLIIRGEWDSLCTDTDASGLFHALTGTSLRRDVKISGATHLMHLESSRFALYRETATFLLASDTPPRT